MLFWQKAKELSFMNTLKPDDMTKKDRLDLKKFEKQGFCEIWPISNATHNFCTLQPV